MTNQTWPDGWYVSSRHYHFCATFYKRYLRPLPPGAYSDMVRQIRSGDAIMIRRDHGRSTSIWGVRIKRPGHGQQKVVVLFNEKMCELVSALPITSRSSFKSAFKDITA